MNIIIPIGGVGERFSKEGYIYPKPLINVLGKPMLFWVIDSLKTSTDDVITIVYREELNSFNFQSLIKNEFSHINFKFVELKSDTRGASETVLCGLNTFSKEELETPIMIADCDTFYKDDVTAQYKNVLGNCIFYFTDNGDKPIFSYIKLYDNLVVDIKEKVKISDNANTGLYCFSSGQFLKTYCEKILNNSFKEKEEFYISDVYRLMLMDGVTINSIKVDEFYCVGTPFQLQLFASNNIDKSKNMRFCFDLDNTLVSYPKIKGDYSSVEPIHQNINMARFLKKAGHTIIIHTARRMKTHSGNVGAVIADVGFVTMETIKKLDIPCDELYFGKPYANFYLDDLGVNPYVSPEKQIGFYNNEIISRSFNKVDILFDKVVKTSTNKTFEGEKYWYQNIPSHIENLFPKVYEISDRIVMEKIKGIPLSNLYVNGSLTEENFKQLLKSLEKIHISRLTEENDLNESIIYKNYITKMELRYDEYNYFKYPNAEKLYNDLCNEFSKYITMNRGIVGVIHGDCVLTNILIQKDNSLKFIDMRGKIDDQLTIFGDIFYDYGKILQSLVGYDHIMHGQIFNRQYMDKFINIFKNYIISEFGEGRYNEVRLITKSLLFSLIPLHDNDKCLKYYNLIYDV